MTYSRMSNSDRLSQMTSPDGFGVIYTYEDQRDLRTAVENRHGTQLISRYGYTYDAVGNRSEATLDGRVFLEALSQRALGSNWIDNVPSGTPEKENPSEHYEYTYDPINNRSTDTTWDDPAQALMDRTYVNNNLNQTTEIQKPSSPTRNLTYDDDGNMTGMQTDTKDLLLTYKESLGVFGDVRQKISYYSSYRLIHRNPVPQSPHRHPWRHNLQLLGFAS